MRQLSIEFINKNKHLFKINQIDRIVINEYRGGYGHRGGIEKERISIKRDSITYSNIDYRNGDFESKEFEGKLMSSWRFNPSKHNPIIDETFNELWNHALRECLIHTQPLTCNHDGNSFDISIEFKDKSFYKTFGYTNLYEEGMMYIADLIKTLIPKGAKYPSVLDKH